MWVECGKSVVVWEGSFVVWNECNVRERRCCGKIAVVWEGSVLRRACGGMTLSMGLRRMKCIETRNDFWDMT